MFEEPYPFYKISILLVKHKFRLDCPLPSRIQLWYTHGTNLTDCRYARISAHTPGHTCGMFSIFLHTNDINQVSTDGKIICITKKSSSDVHGNMRCFCLGWLDKATVGIEDVNIKGFVIVPQKLYTRVLNLTWVWIGIRVWQQSGLE